MWQVEVGRITDADAAKCGRKCGRMRQETQPKCDRYVGKGGVLLGKFPEIFAFFLVNLIDHAPWHDSRVSSTLESRLLPAVLRQSFGFRVLGGDEK